MSQQNVSGCKIPVDTLHIQAHTQVRTPRETKREEYWHRDPFPQLKNWLLACRTRATTNEVRRGELITTPLNRKRSSNGRFYKARIASCSCSSCSIAKHFVGMRRRRYKMMNSSASSVTMPSMSETVETIEALHSWMWCTPFLWPPGKKSWGGLLHPGTDHPCPLV